MRKLCLASSLALVLSVTGCGVKNPPLQIGSSVAGNWAFTAANQQLDLNLGFTQGSYETVSAVGRLHGVACISPATDILLTGSVSATNQMTLVSSPLNGSTVTLRGQLAADSSGMAGTTLTFSGGQCASLGTKAVTATQYSPIGGTYTGNFIDADGNLLAVSAFLEQTTQPNADGQFTLSGTATFPPNTCFVQQPTLTQSVVTGSSLSMTYADAGSTATINASGTFNSAATQLTISSWQIQGGPCNGNFGTGLLNEQ